MQMVDEGSGQVQTLQTFQVRQRKGIRAQAGQQVPLQLQAAQGPAASGPAASDLTNTESRETVRTSFRCVSLSRHRKYKRNHRDASIGRSLIG